MKVYLCDGKDADRETVTKLAAALPAERREKADGYRIPLDRVASILGWHLVSRMIRDLAPGVAVGDWTVDERGRPSLPGGGIAFSLAHSDGLAVAVLAHNPIGVDAELIRPLRPALLPRFCTPDEIARCAGSPDLPILLWTKREAKAKENGRGIAQNLAALPVDGVTSCRVAFGDRAFWVSYTRDEKPEVVILSPEDLL